MISTQNLPLTLFQDTFLPFYYLSIPKLANPITGLLNIFSRLVLNPQDHWFYDISRWLGLRFQVLILKCL